MMKHIVLLTKPYNFFDLHLWYNYHKAMGWTIHIINNGDNSAIRNYMDLNHGDTYEELQGWPNQWQLFDDILNENRFGFRPGELVAFIDDDEYIWYYQDYWKKFEEKIPACENKKYIPLEQYVDDCLYKFDGPERKTDVILMPQILMSTPYIHDNREIQKNLLDLCVYRRVDESAQGKCIIKYNPKVRYQFNNQETAERGHVPYVRDRGEKEFMGVRSSVVNGSAYSDTTYGAVDPTACLRLYHYHIKTKWDWEKKWDRGSAAVDKQWYDKNIYHNAYADGYIMPEFTMQQTKALFEL